MGDNVTPLVVDPVVDQEDKDLQAALDDKNVDDFDYIDDADEALQGLSPQHDSEVLTRIAQDTEVSDDCG